MFNFSADVAMISNILTLLLSLIWHGEKGRRSHEDCNTEVRGQKQLVEALLLKPSQNGQVRWRAENKKTNGCCLVDMRRSVICEGNSTMLVPYQYKWQKICSRSCLTHLTL